MPVRIPRQGNPLYPLPTDYAALSAEGQRLARLNALLLQETPEDVVHAWSFFRRWYLEPEDAHWYKAWCPSPPLHYQMIHDMAAHSRNVWAAPRAFSKTTILREAAILTLLTRPSFDILNLQATIKRYRLGMDAIKTLFETNKYIHDDFTEFFGEPIVPKRGRRPWGTETIRLPNQSTLEGGSVQGALRGARPDLLIIDDPEYDEDQSNDQQALIEDFERLLFKTLLPMLLHGSVMFWIGTLISRQSFLYSVTRGEDPRFTHFNRRVLGIRADDGTLIWPERWDAQTVQDLRTEMGESAFQSEYMNNPGSVTARILKLHPDFGTYSVDGPVHRLGSPLACQDFSIHYKRKIVQGDQITVLNVQEPFGPWASRLYRAITVDFVFKPSHTSDFACIGVWGYDEEDVLWVLDLHLERVRGAPFTRRIFEMAYQWRVRIIGTESVPAQEEISQETAEFVSEMAAGTGYVPRVIPIRYASRKAPRNLDAPTKISKQERIAALEARFARQKIRYPLHRKSEFAIGQLFHQTDYFTLDLSLLRFDDAIDTLAMSQYLPRRRGDRPPNAPPSNQIVDLLRSGRTVDPATGIPYAASGSSDVFTPDVLSRLRRQKYGDRYTQEKEISQWPPGPPRLTF